ncbi:hypothetical protein UFOVP629_116 [uncultured Caudovirales phage]|uniref:Peptidase S74 domain-containing protein n=1 Tax=uncultured Caudovirales phage TaxID=2100421 RepID=A0A6J5NB75_9CAUD|nr:hypothetical protein UFOVP629_116 [uncultured Caudovirales phage]
MPRNDLIQVRSDTSSNWTSVNPTLATGEIGFESNTGKFKIGTGSTAWSSLPYTSDTAGSATTADTWTTARTITLAGDLTGSASIDGSTNVSLSATIAANSVALGTDTTGNYMSAISGTSPVTVSHTAGEGSSASVSLAAGYGDTLNPYASKTAKYFLATPNDASGVPTFRAIVAADIPTLNQSTTGNAATATKWSTARTISLTGDITGSDSIDGSGNISISATIGSGKITAAMIAANAVTASEIASGAVTNSEVSGTADIALSKLATTGTMTATTFSGSGSSLTSLPAGQLTGTVNSAVDVPASTLTGTISTSRISGAYNGITDVGTLTSGLSVTGTINASSAITITGAGEEFRAVGPSVGSGYAAEWVGIGSYWHLYRNSSTRVDKENIQPLNGVINPSMIDDIDISLWNRKTAVGIPEIGPMAEDMDDISPFLSTRGLDWDENGEPFATPPNGINQKSWMSLLTIGIQDIRQRLAKLENPDV